MISDRGKILKETELFYANLYEGKITNENIIKVNRNPENTIKMPTLKKYMTMNQTKRECNKKMKNNKTTGEDNILPEIIKECDETTKEELRTLYNRCLIQRPVPEGWKNAIVMLIQKKGDPTNLENYRPISLLSQIAKLFMRIIIG